MLCCSSSSSSSWWFYSSVAVASLYAAAEGVLFRSSVTLGTVTRFSN